MRGSIRAALLATLLLLATPGTAQAVTVTGRTVAADQITTSSARLNCDVTSSSGTATVWFRYGPTASLGSSTPAAKVSTAGGTYRYSYTLTGLPASATRFFACKVKFGSLGAALSFTTQASAPPPPPSSGSLRDATDLIYGSEIGNWDRAGGAAVSNVTVVQRGRDAGVTTIRYSVFDCFVGMTCGTDHHAGTIQAADFRTVIQTITSSSGYGARLFLKMVPVDDAIIANNVVGSRFCPHWSDDGTLDDNLPLYRRVLDEVKAAGYLGPIVIESSNEMEYDCWAAWKAQGAPITGAGSVGVSKRIGEHFAATMPPLKAYARTLGFAEVLTVGYVGVSGGPQWGQACTADSTRPFGYACAYQPRWAAEFNTAVHDAYVASGGDPDFIPDAVSIHSYCHGNDFSSAAGAEFDDNMCFAFYRNWLVQTRAVLRGIWGAVGDGILFSMSEWNAGESNTSTVWSGWSTAGRPEQFFRGWYSMLRGDGVMTGSGTRWWDSHLFLIAGNSDTGAGRFYNWIRRDGTVPAWYGTIQTQMLSGY